LFTTTSTDSCTASRSGILEEELASIARTPARDLVRRRDRIAFTIRPRRRGGDSLPRRLVRPEAFQAFCLSYRRIDGGRGDAQTRALLGVYRAVADTSGGVPLRFACERVFDLGRRRGRGALDASREPELARAAVLLDQALADTDEADLAGGLRLPVVYFGYEPRSVPAFAGERSGGTSIALAEPVENLLAWPASPILAMQADLTPRPAAVFVSLAGLAGRTIRNPAFPVLRQHGLIESGPSYAAWLDSLGDQKGGDGVVADPSDESTPASQFRARLTDYATLGSQQERALLTDLRVRCDAFGLSAPAGLCGLDFCVRLLDNPWQPLEVPGAAAVQVVALEGEPSPETLTFEQPTARVDLHEIERVPGRRRSRRAANTRATWPSVAGFR
jgi:hypothetical protein